MNRILLLSSLSLGLLLVAGCDSEAEGDEAGECSDGVDNDQNGDTDCADDACAGAPACAGDDDSAGDDDDSSDLDCRPVNEPWIPGTPLRLPCTATTEPCDGIDNDNDGFTDPHCPTMPCTGNVSCQFGGVLLDADCNIFNQPEPGCNPIDGVIGDGNPFDCLGMLCPPNLKCFAGNCIQPGTQLPGAPCSSGTDCPIHAGCIPSVPGDDTSAVCMYFCDYIPCPAGFTCFTYTEPSPGGVDITMSSCH